MKGPERAFMFNQKKSKSDENNQRKTNQGYGKAR